MTSLSRNPSAGMRALPQRLTMLVAAAALLLAGLGATARPAKADADDILRFLAGAIVVGAIVNAIDDNHTPQYYGRWALPNSCLETIRVNHRNVQSYNARCLRRAGYQGLPGRCSYEFRLRGGHVRRGYIAECLYEAGYRGQGGYYSSPPRYQPPYSPPIQAQPPRVSPPYHGQPLVRGNLPNRCLMSYRQNGRSVQGYWASCLRNAGYNNLPGRCRVTATNGDRIFNATCLRQSGY
ncbi:hypothetical protein [Pararhodobacter marinus]|uniref:hypothetical protein n=1 Tax=Pararhodobacter marinus TaxID=2184063 RepID=UPI003513E330